jgi:hypothetical protein
MLSEGSTQFFQEGRVIIEAKFHHPFIMSNVICIIWYGLHYGFLGETEEEKLENLRFIWVLTGATTFCSLYKQSEDTVQVDCFGGMAYNRKFLAILNAIDSLMDDELAEL